jgi:hypothetical protein
MVGRNFAKEQPADSSKFLWNSDSALVVAVRVKMYVDREADSMAEVALVGSALRKAIR